jgi:SAM-dependent methyltransferase
MTPYYPETYEFFFTYERRLRSPLRTLARWYGLYKRTQIVIKACGRHRGSILDVGCASGAFLVAMRGRGWSVQGVEPSAAAVATARSHGLAVHHGVLETAELTPGQFDALTLWDVLEHVPEPLDTLHAAAAALKPGGVVVIRVPNPLGLDARLFGRYWTGLDMPRHLWLYTWRQLKLLLAQAGFAAAQRRWDYTPYHLWRFSAEFWLNDHTPPLLARMLQSMLRSPLTQLATWPCFQTITHSELNSMLLVAAYRQHLP